MGGVRVSRVLGLCMAAAMSGAAAAQTVEQDGDLTVLLVAMKQDLAGFEQQSRAADIALTEAREARDAIDRRIKRDESFRRQLGRPIAETDALRADRAALSVADAEIQRLEKAASEKAERLRLEKERYDAYAKAVEPDPNASEQAQRSDGQEQEQEQERNASASDPEPQCGLGDTQKREGHTPHLCGQKTGGIGGTFALGDRVIDQRGVSAQISAAAEGTKATLKLSDTFRFRVPESEGAQRQRNWNYSIGLQAEMKDKQARVAGIGEKDERRNIGQLDQLDQSLTLFGSIGRAYFAREDGGSFEQRARVMYEAARKACREDQKQLKPVKLSTCEDPQLVEWIFAAKDGVYANPMHVAAYNAVYWGSPRRFARDGFGLTFSVARPEFPHYPFRTMQVADPFSPGKTKTIVDPSYIPPGFLAAEPEPLKPRHLAWTLGVYGFHHFPHFAFDPERPDRERWGTTLIPTLTYKRDWKAADDVIICPPAADGVTTNELCRTVKVADGVKTEGLVLAVEARSLIGTGLFGRLLFPEIGIAPKLSFDTNEERYSADIPLFFALDDKQKLHGGLRFAYEFGGLDATGAERNAQSQLSIFLGSSFDLGSK